MGETVCLRPKSVPPCRPGFDRFRTVAERFCKVVFEPELLGFQFIWFDRTGLGLFVLKSSELLTRFIEEDGLWNRVRPRTKPPRLPELEELRLTFGLRIMGLSFTEREGLREILGLGVKLRSIEVEGTEEPARLEG